MEQTISSASGTFAHSCYVLAFDTANEVIATGLGALCASERTVEVVACEQVAAHRASNTQLLVCIDGLLARAGVGRDEIVCVVCGRGPGSFTGVRIAMATAKGIASALEVALVGVSSLDAVAWRAQAAGVRGNLVVVGDAMRKEVYPAHFVVGDRDVVRLGADRVVKAKAAAKELEVGAGTTQYITGDALYKYIDLFALCGKPLPDNMWTPTGQGLLLAFQAAWRVGMADPFDRERHNPAFLLPVYTRLSDAEENERIRLSKNDPKNLKTGVQDVALRRDRRASMHDTAILNARPDKAGITYKPLDAAHTSDVAAMEARIMGTDAWSASLVADELLRSDRVWWAAYANVTLSGEVSPSGEAALYEQDKLRLIGYAGGWIIDGQVQILKVGVDTPWRRRGIAHKLLAHVAADSRNLGATLCSLEVRAANKGAQAFYKALGFHVLGVRPHYYSDGEDALMLEGPLPLIEHDVAGMALYIDEARAASHVDDACAASHVDDTRAASHLRGASMFFKEDGAHTQKDTKCFVRPLILAIESSCDETAAALVDGNGTLISDVVATQIDFHARFGGVVPEIASRKHIEAVCGVCDECLDVAAKHLGISRLTWQNLDAVAATYTPGLVGALVVGVAFAKGAAWACKLPFIGVHHLEGHLYANKIGTPDFTPPAVVSLVSGGNTLLVHMKDWGNYETLGATIDDAVGEAFDKVAKALGLGYPGGPIISQLALRGNCRAIAFPRALFYSGDLRVSLSGLKTAVITYINNEREQKHTLQVCDICASFQQAVIDVQIKKAEMALEQTKAPTFCLGGGVAANPALRQAYKTLCKQRGVRLVMPPLSACGDNAGMIALVALDRYRQGKFFGLDADAYAHTNLDDPY